VIPEPQGGEKPPGCRRRDEGRRKNESLGARQQAGRRIYSALQGKKGKKGVAEFKPSKDFLGVLPSPRNTKTTKNKTEGKKKERNRCVC